MIVDTSFILDIIDDVDAAVSKERELDADGVPLVIPSTTVLELYIGIGKLANTEDKRQQVETILDAYPLVDMTPRIARRAGRLLGECTTETAGEERPGIRKGDAAIAATAIERDEAVLAANERYVTVPSVTLERYR